MDCESLTPTQGAAQQSVDCESLTPTQGATQQSMGVKKRGKESGRQNCILRDPQKKGSKIRSVAPTKGSKIRSGCLTPIFSGAQKRAEMLRHPCILGDTQHRGTKSEVAASPLPSRGPKRGRQCCVNPAFSGSPTEGDRNKSGPQKGGSAMSTLRSRGSPNKGTKSKVAHNWVEVLRNPYVLGVPEKGFKNGPCRAPEKNPIVGVLKGGP